MPQTSNRGKSMPESPIRKLVPLADKAKARGIKVYHLNIGQPDLDTPQIGLDAIRNIDRKILEYSPSDGFKSLRIKLASYYRSFNLDVTLDDIIITTGGSEAVSFAFMSCLDPGDEIIVPEPAYANYTAFAIGAGAVVKPVVSSIDEGFALPSIEKFEELITPRTKGILICNPNNPTGTFVPGAELEAFLAKVPRHVLVVLDEAYTEYLAPAQRYDAIGWIQRFPNLLVSRTFSKAYGLAGLRVGYGLGNPAVIDLLNRVRQPFNVNSLAQEAAIAALDDEAFVLRARRVNNAGLKQLTKGFKKLGLEVVPSAANFMLVKVGDGAAVFQKLQKAGVIVRPVAGYGLPEWVRVTVGTKAQNERLLAAMAS